MTDARPICRLPISRGPSGGPHGRGAGTGRQWRRPPEFGTCLRRREYRWQYADQATSGYEGRQGLPGGEAFFALATE